MPRRVLPRPHRVRSGGVERTSVAEMRAAHRKLAVLGRQVQRALTVLRVYVLAGTMRSLLTIKRLIWGVLLLVVSAVAGLSYVSGTRYVMAVEAVDQTLAVQSAIDGTLSLIKDAETGQRGYLLTGNEQFLEPYQAARTGLPRHLSDLQEVAARDPAQLVLFGELQHITSAKFDFIEASIGLRKQNDEERAMALVRAGRGKQLMDDLRAVCARMWDHEQTLLNARRVEAGAAKQVATWGVGVGGLFSVFLAAASFLTINRDMTALRRTSEKLASSEEHYRLLAESTSDLVRLLDAQGKVSYVSPSVEALLGYQVEEFMALAPRSLMHPDELQVAASILGDIARKVVTSGSSTYRLRHRDGDYRWFEVHWSVQRDAAGALTGIHTVGRDVTERKRRDRIMAEQAEQLRSLSTRDELTQLYNRRGFVEQANEARARGVKAGRIAALLFIDLNGMKRINDELGHDAGDDALQDAAAVINQALPRDSIVGRLGGDEFVAFAVGFSADELEPLRRRLRSLADECVAAQTRPYRLSMSLGAAFTTPDSTQSLDDLIDGADAAMYEQKRARQAAGGVSVAPPPARS